MHRASLFLATFFIASTALSEPLSEPSNTAKSSGLAYYSSVIKKRFQGKPLTRKEAQTLSSLKKWTVISLAVAGTLGGAGLYRLYRGHPATDDTPPPPAWQTYYEADADTDDDEDEDDAELSPRTAALSKRRKRTSGRTWRKKRSQRPPIDLTRYQIPPHGADDPDSSQQRKDTTTPEKQREARIIVVQDQITKQESVCKALLQKQAQGVLNLVDQRSLSGEISRVNQELLRLGMLLQAIQTEKAKRQANIEATQQQREGLLRGLNAHDRDDEKSAPADSEDEDDWT